MRWYIGWWTLTKNQRGVAYSHPVFNSLYTTQQGFRVYHIPHTMPYGPMVSYPMLLAILAVEELPSSSFMYCPNWRRLVWLTKVDQYCYPCDMVVSIIGWRCWCIHYPRIGRVISSQNEQDGWLVANIILLILIIIAWWRERLFNPPQPYL